MKKTGNLKMAVIVCAATLLVVGVVILAFVADSRLGERTGIVLPGADEGVQDVSPNTDVKRLYLTITPQNVTRAVATLTRPAAFHQSLVITFGAGAYQSEKTVEIWTLSNIHRVDITVGGTQKSYLTDGKSLYIWYGDASTRIRRLELDGTVSFDDLCGVPTYESLLAVKPQEITDASYVQLEELQQEPCVFARVQTAENSATHYWISMNSGLLCRATAELSDAVIYQLKQTAIEFPSAADAELSERLSLPDGSQPFPFTIAQEEMPQS